MDGYTRQARSADSAFDIDCFFGVGRARGALAPADAKAHTPCGAAAQAVGSKHARTATYLIRGTVALNRTAPPPAGGRWLPGGQLP